MSAEAKRKMVEQALEYAIDAAVIKRPADLLGFVIDRLRVGALPLRPQPMIPTPARHAPHRKLPVSRLAAHAPAHGVQAAYARSNCALATITPSRPSCFFQEWEGEQERIGSSPPQYARLLLSPEAGAGSKVRIDAMPIAGIEDPLHPDSITVGVTPAVSAKLDMERLAAEVVQLAVLGALAEAC